MQEVEERMKEVGEIEEWKKRTEELDRQVQKELQDFADEVKKTALALGNIYIYQQSFFLSVLLQNINVRHFVIFLFTFIPFQNMELDAGRIKVAANKCSVLETRLKRM